MDDLRQLAEDVRPRSANPAYLCRRSVLETSLMTAGEVVDRIKKNLGVPWRDTHVSRHLQVRRPGHGGHGHRDDGVLLLRGSSSGPARPAAT